MQFSLRTLLIVMLLGGPVLAGAWWGWKALPPFSPMYLGMLLEVFVFIAFWTYWIVATTIILFIALPAFWRSTRW